MTIPESAQSTPVRQPAKRRYRDLPANITLPAYALEKYLSFDDAARQAVAVHRVDVAERDRCSDRVRDRRREVEEMEAEAPRVDRNEELRKRHAEAVEAAPEALKMDETLYRRSSEKAARLSGSTEDIINVIAWAAPEVLVAALVRNIDPDVDKSAMTAEAHLAKLAEFDVAILANERMEDLAVAEAVVQGHDVARCPNADPRAVLEVLDPSDAMQEAAA